MGEDSTLKISVAEKAKEAYPFLKAFVVIAIILLFLWFVYSLARGY